MSAYGVVFIVAVAMLIDVLLGIYISVLQCVAVCCSVLQCVAGCRCTMSAYGAVCVAVKIWRDLLLGICIYLTERGGMNEREECVCVCVCCGAVLFVAASFTSISQQNNSEISCYKHDRV